MQENIKLVTVKKTVRQAYRTEPIWQYDVGHVLNLEGFDNLPETFQMHYSHSPMGDAITQIGSNGQVSLPDEFAQTSAPIFAWVYVAEDDTGLTKYTIEIPVMRRAKITNQEPTPVEQSAIDQAISALNAGVARAETAAANAEASEDAASASAESAYRSSEAAAGAAESAAGDATAAGRSATAAGESASAAAASAANASGSATTAGNAATAAQAAANTATQKSGEAVSSANSAAASALSAGQSAQTATQKANDATSAATSAQGSASAASGSATAAGQSATAAAGSAAAAAQTKGAIDDEVTGFQAQLTELSSAISQKQDKATNEGTPGQFFSKDSEGNPIWADAPGADESGLAPVIKSTASGEIASFSDGADGRQIDSLVVNIEPVQDLHGYDSPWPAGGNVNLFPYNVTVGTQTINGVTWNLHEDGSISISGTATDASTFRYIYNVTNFGPYFSGNYKFYVFPGNISTPVFQCGIKIGVKWYSAYANGNNNLSDADGQITEAWFQVRAGQTLNTTIYPMIYSAEITAPTSWTPYSNICPISGWTGCEVNRTGKNLFDPTTAITGKCVRAGNVSESSPLGEEISNPSWNCSDYIKVNPNTVYTQTLSRYTAATAAGLVFYSSADISGAISGVPTSVQAGTVYTFTTPSECKYIRVSWNNESDNPPQIEAGTGTPYTPYTGSTLPISWQSVAGTVYGGTLDVISGVLTVTHAIADLGDCTWLRQGGGRFSTDNLPSIVYENGNIDCISDSYASTENVTMGAWNSKPNNTIGGASSRARLVVKDERFDDAAEFKAAVAGKHVVYTLGTPQTYQLSPNTLTTLLGINNIFADCGSVESVVYSADTKNYIDDSVKVQDVKVNGASILTDGIANVPVASSSAFGVVKSDGNYGITVNSNGIVRTNPATAALIKGGGNENLPITPVRQHQAAFYGLAKAAGDSTQASSSNAVGNYTESAKSAISTMLNGSVSITGTTPTITALPGIRYVCGEVATLTVNLPASGIVDIVFESGSTATVLTITPPTGVTVKWANGFDPSSLDANTTYEINIADGLGVAASWT